MTPDLAQLASGIFSSLFLALTVAALVAVIAPNLPRIIDALLGE